MSIATAMTALLIFQIKHFICDFALQTKWQIEGKQTYLGPGGLVHAGLHAIGTLPALYVMGVPGWMYAAIPLGEFVLHNHIDWAKAQIDATFGPDPTKLRHWIVFGTDQLLHQLTYLGFVAWYAGVI
jgi:hypothetical protein